MALKLSSPYPSVDMHIEYNHLTKLRGIRFERSLWEPDVWNFILLTELLYMKGKLAVKLSITDLTKISRE